MIQEILYLGQCHKRRRPSLCIKVTKKSSIFSCYTNILKTAQGVTYHWLHLSCLWLVRCPRNYSCPRWVVWWSFSACAIPWFKAPAWFPFPQVRSGRCRARTTLRRSVSAKWVAWLVLRGVQGRVYHSRKGLMQFLFRVKFYKEASRNGLCLRSPGFAQELKASLAGSSSKVVKCQCSSGCCCLFHKTNGMRSCLWEPLLWALAWKGQAASICILKSLEVSNSSKSFLYGEAGRKSIEKIITWSWRYLLCTWTKMCFAMEDMKCGTFWCCSGVGRQWCSLWRWLFIMKRSPYTG